MKFQFRNKLVNIPVRFILGMVLCALLLFAFAALAHEVVGEREDWFDTKVFEFFQSNSTPAIVSVFNRVTFFGSRTFLLPVYTLIVFYLLYKRRWEDAINIALVATISNVFVYGFKAFFARKRPELPLIRELSDYSFPSGHAASAFVFCGVLTWLLWKSNLPKGWKIVITLFLVLIAVSIGISRIVLRYHYASDVVAGFCWAVAWVILYFFLAGKWRKYFVRSKK